MKKDKDNSKKAPQQANTDPMVSKASVTIIALFF